MSSFLNTISFPTSLKRKADGVTVVQIYEVGSSDPITQGVTVNWTEINGQIRINHITGLKPSKKYKMRVLVV